MKCERKVNFIIHELMGRICFFTLTLMLMRFSFVDTLDGCSKSMNLSPCKCKLEILSCVNIKNVDFAKYFKNLKETLGKEDDKTYLKIEIRHRYYTYS